MAAMTHTSGNTVRTRKCDKIVVGASSGERAIPWKHANVSQKETQCQFRKRSRVVSASVPVAAVIGVERISEQTRANE